MTFLCNSCHVQFNDIDEMKEHYKTDLHVLNLKRRSKNLPPVSQSNFEKIAPIIVKSQQTTLVPAKTGSNADKLKMFDNNNSNDVNNKKVLNQNNSDISETEVEQHKTKVENVDETKMDNAGDKNMIPLPIGSNISIFDNKSFDSSESCVDYMVKTFGFFIPDFEYLDDLDSLLVFLSEKVKLDATCLFCQRRFRSGRACQNHMITMSHCKVAYEEGVDQEQLEEFYDFSESYEDVDDDEEDDPVAEISPITGELILPDGRILGNRDFRRYYKQHYGPVESRPSILAQKREELLRLGKVPVIGEQTPTEVVSAMTDVQVQAALVLHYKASRKAQIAEQRGMIRQLAAAQQMEYKSKIAAARSSATTTAKIRDYHKTVM